MSSGNCPCGGNNIDRFYALFTCDHANCAQCHWTNNQCCNGISTENDSLNCDSDCINFYNLTLQDVITSKLKAFGYCEKHKALGVQFIDGTKKLYLNVDKDLYDGLVALNKDSLFMYLQNYICNDSHQCINIP